jgi:hypothetical protein
MDTWLEKGDHGTDGRGLPLAIDGEKEWVQQAMIRLCVPRGSFILDRELGSRFYSINPAQPRLLLEEQALLYAKEALLPMADAQVEWAKCWGSSAGGQGRLEITVKIARRGRDYSVEVKTAVPG